ncbi:MAG: DivIVA domain-containing protein [Egibacteraceae bacterium]
MTLTPEDIERKVFKQEFRGYNQEEVDTFLDLVVDRMVELSRERDLLTSKLQDAERSMNERIARVESYADERIADIETRASEAIQNERLLKRALVTAERAADQTMTQANLQAEQAVTRAKAEAGRMIAEARQEADQLLEDARRQATDMLVEAKELTNQAEESYRFERDRIQRTVADFNQGRDEYRDRVRAILGEHLTRFERAGELPHPPPQLIDLAQIPQPRWPEFPEWGVSDAEPAATADTGNGDPSQPPSE